MAVVSLKERMLEIGDWRHPYLIEGKPNKLEKEWFRDWHPWRWGVDKKVLEEALGQFGGHTFLDVACNDGWYGMQAAQAGATVLGIDGRQEAIDRANLIRDYFNVERLEFRVGDIESRETVSGAFDAVLFYGILYHLADPIRVLARMGEVTGRIICVQTFIHALESDPVLYLLRESPELAGKALTQLITTPTQRSVVMMLKEAGFDHVYRGMPSDYFAGQVNSNGRWQWCFFYGVKGSPLRETKELRRIEEFDKPLNHFGLFSRVKGVVEHQMRRRLGRDTRGGF